MSDFDSIHRRSFLLSSAAVIGAGLAAKPMFAAEDKPQSKNIYPLKKALKYGMIKEGNSFEEKFNLIKGLGYKGVELNSPNKFDRDEVVRAIDKTGIEVHGVIVGPHWGTRHSDPNPEVRAKALQNLKTAIEDCKAYGGTTILLVPGKVTNRETENYAQVYERSQSEIKKAVPLAEDLGVKIAIEVVWNNFLTKPGEMNQYVDEFNSPAVGAYFDTSNMLKFGAPSEFWIRKLGKRMLKFDLKGYKHDDQWVDIGDGDENWPAILAALKDIGYTGWATAEVAGGNEAALRDISERMDRIFTIPDAGLDVSAKS
ncbi:MAG: sugar phosphate isomerase/epimerase family protein [Planctomycetota bacterium]|nr:sugar phosphate isomerase/epimerase family protein [Planctomycetota bacterium]